MQHHRPRAQLDPREMRVSRNNLHELGQLDPKDVFEREELRPRFLVELVDFGGGEEGRRQGLGHGVAQVAPEGTVLVHRGGDAGPGCVWMFGVRIGAA